MGGGWASVGESGWVAAWGVGIGGGWAWGVVRCAHRMHRPQERIGTGCMPAATAGAVGALPLPEPCHAPHAMCHSAAPYSAVGSFLLAAPYMTVIPQGHGVLARRTTTCPYSRGRHRPESNVQVLQPPNAVTGTHPYPPPGGPHARLLRHPGGAPAAQLRSVRRVLHVLAAVLGAGALHGADRPERCPWWAERAPAI